MTFLSLLLVALLTLRTVADAPPTKPVCSPPSPPLFAANPPAVSDSRIASASSQFRDFLQQALNNDTSVDSYAVAVVSSTGTILEATFGKLKANETNPGQVTRDSLYRVASLSKLFATVEVLQLRQKNALSLDDTVDKFLPSFVPSRLPGGGAREPISIRQLLAHLSGLGRDLPPGNMTDWPHSLAGLLGPGVSSPIPTEAQLLQSISSIERAVDPWSLPIYSNTGYDVVGLVVDAADAKLRGVARSGYSAVMQRDVFTPLGMTATGFKVTSQNAAKVVVSSVVPAEADTDYTDVLNAAIGQLSSLADLQKVVPMLLNAATKGALLTASTLREWFRPVHLWQDHATEVGLLWEIARRQDSFGRTYRTYEKLGVLNSYHHVFTLNPSSGYSVIVLTSGAFANTHDIAQKAYSLYQPAFDAILTEQLTSKYAGTWKSGNSTVSIAVGSGGLWVTGLVLDGEDVLKVVQGSDSAVALWPASGTEIYRCVLSCSERKANDALKCIPNWLSVDFGHKNGISVDLLTFATQNGARVLQVPALGLTLSR
ncbi:beta-lactamase/transpeptidase-like protein [Exidia glandulosa HHB12029]|uniref:Beta-lactamase/transpeptidase-like protein n=1 Tax=Exidia glandulosa HHB12029 TaxID=1314781 RepID=A0A165QZB1_EXIGL|nr:beta-lactamase/transpeptidase-like protein [Exidia glandulosa HHB12029]